MNLGTNTITVKIENMQLSRKILNFNTSKTKDEKIIQAGKMEIKQWHKNLDEGDW